MAFVFESIYTFVGTIILICVIGDVIAKIIRASRGDKEEDEG